MWRVSGHEVPVKAVVACVEGYTKRFTLVTSATELTGLRMVELFAARFRQEDGFRHSKQRLGWEECRAWTKNPIQRTSQARWVTMSPLRLARFRLGAEGAVDWWFRPPWNRKKDRPSVLDVEQRRVENGLTGRSFDDSRDPFLLPNPKSWETNRPHRPTTDVSLGT